MARDWWKTLQELGGVIEGHTVFSSGRHGATLIESAVLSEQPWLLGEACSDLLKYVYARGLGEHVERAQRVVGSALGGVALAYEFARLTDKHFGFTERPQQGGAMQLQRFRVAPGERVLVVEDVGTTFGTTRETIAALEHAGATVVPLVLALVNRGTVRNLEGRAVVSLVEYTLPSWEPEACPICNG